MANVKISNLPVAATVDGASSVPVVEGGVTKQVTFTGMLTSPALFASGMAAFFATPSSANLRAALTDETGSGAAVFADSPTLTGAVNVTGTVAATKLIPTGNVTAGNGMYLPTTNTLAWSTNGVEGMRLDASGNLGVGASPTANERIRAEGSEARIRSRNSTSGTEVYVGAMSPDEARVWASTNSPLTFGTNDTERARITSVGDLLVGTSTTGGGYTTNSLVTIQARTGEGAQILINDSGSAQWVQWQWNKGTTGDNLFTEFGTEGTFTGRGSITYNRAGGLVAYNTTSDYRAKDILGPVANPGATIDALKVYTGKMKGATVERPMLVAHEAQAVAPYSVTGEKDEVNEDGTPKYQQMDVSALVPLLIAEIQSLRARVAALEA